MEVPPENGRILEVIGHEGDWDWVILPPDVNGTRRAQLGGFRRGLDSRKEAPDEAGARGGAEDEGRTSPAGSRKRLCD